VDDAIACVVAHALPLFARVARARGIEPPARWATLPKLPRLPPPEEPAREAPLSAAELDALPRVVAPTAASEIELEEILAHAQKYLDGVRARLSSSPMRDALEIVAPRSRDLVAAASAILVPYQRAIFAKLTPGQRRFVERMGMPMVDPEMHLTGLAPTALERQAAEAMKMIASHLRVSRGDMTGENATALDPMIAAAEAYERALVAVGPPPRPRPRDRIFV